MSLYMEGKTLEFQNYPYVLFQKNGCEYQYHVFYIFMPSVNISTCKGPLEDLISEEPNHDGRL